jgi:hypothetical protein
MDSSPDVPITNRVRRSAVAGGDLPMEDGATESGRAPVPISPAMRCGDRRTSSSVAERGASWSTLRVVGAALVSRVRPLHC